MGHHKVDVILREIVERGWQKVGRPLRQDKTDELVVELDVRFLVGRARVAIEDVCEPVAVRVALDRVGVGELKCRCR